jgi:hypothetical protein
LLEYHLRHYFIMTLYRELDRHKEIPVEPKPHQRMRRSLLASADRELVANRQ